MIRKLQNLSATAILILTALSNAQAQSWSELGGTNSLQANDFITTIYSDATNNIYIGSASSFVPPQISRYNGTAWSILGLPYGLPSPNATSISDITGDAAGNLYIAGFLGNPNGSSYILKWNSATDTYTQISGIYDGNSSNTSMAILTDTAGNIFTAGSFIDSIGHTYVAKYNGTSWGELGGVAGTQSNDVITALVRDAAGNIYSGGYFHHAIDNNAYVNKWDAATNTWSELGGTNSLHANNPILCMTHDAAGNIYAAGWFTNASGKEYVAKWDHNLNTWSELGGDNSLQANSIIQAITCDTAGNIYVGGDFTNAANKHYIAKWDHTSNTWSELGGTNSLQANNGVLALSTDVAGNIYTAGAFTNANGKEYVAKYTPLPVSISATQSSTCQGANVTFVASLANVIAPFTLQWKVNGNNVGTNSSSYTYTPANNDTVTCILTTSTTSDTSKSIIMQVIPSVTPTVSITVNPTGNINNGTAVTFSSTAVNAGSNPQYQWLKTGQPIAGATSTTWNTVAGTGFVSADIISLQMRSDATCAMPDTVISNAITMTTNATAINNTKNGIALTLYPNPNDGNFRLDGTLKEGGTYEIIVTNILGQRLFSKSIIAAGQQLSSNISIAQLPAGSYALSLNKDGETKASALFVKAK